MADVVTSYNNIAEARAAKREYDQALEIYQWSLDIFRAAFGDHHNIAGVHDTEGDYERA